MKLTKDEVVEFLRIKDIADQRAEEVCREHFLKTHYKEHDMRSRFYRPTEFQRVTDIGKEFITYSWYWFETEYDNSVPVKALYEDIDFPDQVSEINKKILEENKRIKQELVEKDRKKYLELKERFE